MECLYCHHPRTEVTNSRPSAKTSKIWRRRKCPNCEHIFSTVEYPSMIDTYRVENEHIHQTLPYSHSKLAFSLMPALSTIKETERHSTLDALMNTIEQRLVKRTHDTKISSDELIALAYEVLKSFDAVVGLQYAVQQGFLNTVAKKRRGRPSIS